MGLFLCGLLFSFHTQKKKEAKKKCYFLIERGFCFVLSYGLVQIYVCGMVERIDLYTAIHEMRKLTARGKTFSFVHAAFDKKKRITSGVRAVKVAKLRPAAREDDVSFANFKLFYYDEEIREPRVCWQPLIMFFNNKKIKLS